jgi:choline dehydrogenase-like flavoprotein
MNDKYIYDVCIIGSGPAGLVSALKLGQLGHDVVLIERGTEKITPISESLSHAEILSHKAHSKMVDATQSILGGTSSIWGGRCVPFDPIDFAKRDYVCGAEWPISHQEIEPYYQEASDFLSIENNSFDISQCQNNKTKHNPISEMFINNKTLSGSSLERWSKIINVWHVHKSSINNLKNITIMSNKACVGFYQQESDTEVDFALVKDTNKPELPSEKIFARHFIIAAGGVESTRLILNSMDDTNGLKPTSRELIGKYYMGHPSGKIANIVLNGDPNKTIYGFELDQETYIRRRITLSEQTQLENKTLNIAFWLDNPALADWKHGNGVLSSAYLALTMPFIGKRLAPQAIINRLTEGYPKQYWPHIKNCLTSPIKTLSFVVSFIYKRYFSTVRIPGFFIKSKNNTYALHYHSEQVPNKKSTISLSEQTDIFGLKLAKINLAWSDQDINSIIKSHKILNTALLNNNIGHLEFLYSDSEQKLAIVDQAVDGFHQIGTLKMSDDPAKGVTNPLGAVYGCSNLYVSSSAIFPSSSQANPTLLIVALAIRQVEHLHQTLNSKDTQ